MCSDDPRKAVRAVGLEVRDLPFWRGERTMMLQFFGNDAKGKPSRKKSSRRIKQDAVSERVDSSEDASLRLEKELAVLLARKPKHRISTQIADSEDHDDEASLLPADDSGFFDAVGEAEETVEIDIPETALGNETRTDAVASSEPSKMSDSETRERWMRSSWRSRRSNLFRKTASVAITFAVTTFIISIVAVILFGMPDGFKKLIATNDRTAAISSNVSPTNTADHAPVRMRWVSY